MPWCVVSDCVAAATSASLGERQWKTATGELRMSEPLPDVDLSPASVSSVSSSRNSVNDAAMFEPRPTEHRVPGSAPNALLYPCSHHARNRVRRSRGAKAPHTRSESARHNAIDASSVHCPGLRKNRLYLERSQMAESKPVSSVAP
eukprot:Amastigsp_a676195_31.p4 type:complete len:146 gc:universal Amastigsp_a676195_31:894-1331(+)